MKIPRLKKSVAPEAFSDDFDQDESLPLGKRSILSQEEEQEKRQYRNLIIFIVLLLILIVVSVFFKPDLKEVHLKGKAGTEIAPPANTKPPEGGQKSAGGEKKAESDMPATAAGGKGGGSGGGGGSGRGSESGGGGESGGGEGGGSESAGGENSAISEPTPSAPLSSSQAEGLPPSQATAPLKSDSEESVTPTTAVAPAATKVFLRDVHISKSRDNERKIFAEAINITGKPLNNIIILIKFLDYDKNVIYERTVNALVVGGGLFGDQHQPLPDGELRKFSVGLDDLPKGWGGQFETEIKVYE